jgi:hypothetical protein
MKYATVTYYKKANGQIDEALTVTNSLKNRDIQSASIILDFKNQVVVKATLDGSSVPRDWDTIVAYYYEHYKATFERLFVENGHVLPEPTTEEVIEKT